MGAARQHIAKMKEEQDYRERRGKRAREEAAAKLGLRPGEKIGFGGGTSSNPATTAKKKNNKKKPDTAMAPTSEEEQAMKRKSLPGEENIAKKTLLGV